MTILNGRYEIHERLGEGGMAVVYRATQLNLDREVAVKFIKTEVLGQEFVSRFEREAKAIAKLNHPTITQVYDFDHDETGRPFMVMELLHGNDLGGFVALNAPLQIGDVLTIMEGVAMALGFAHGRGIVHRDVKPTNIFITHDRQVKLMDFGLVKQASADVDLTGSGVLLGTPRYFSPEQARAKPTDHRSDIYSLGVILYELLTNQPPFTADNPIDLAMQHVSAPVPDPRDVVPDLPPIASTITRRMLAKQPEDRYPGAAALLEDLAQFEEVIKRETGLLPRLAVNPSEIRDVPTPIFSTPLNAKTTADASNPTAILGRTRSQEILRRHIPVPLPLLVVLLVGLVLIGALVAGGLAEDTSDGLPTLSITPPGTDEYLILVGQWGEEADTLERRIIETLGSSDAVGMASNLDLRIEPIEYAVMTSEDAQTLAESVGAHLIIWGIEDEVGVEVVFQDVFPEPDSASRIRFVVPNSDDYASIVAEDMPIALRFFLSSMLLHHFVRTDNIDALASFAFTSESNSVEELRVLPASDLDRHILRLFIWREGEDNVGNAINAATDALRLAPGDPSLVFLRGFYEGFYRGDINRARADADLLREILGETNFTIWVDMNVSLVEQDYAQIIALSERLDPDTLGYGIPFSYRQMALAMTGDFAQVQMETQGAVREQAVFGLPVWDAMAALMYEIQGDAAGFETTAARVGANRDLEDSASFVTGVPSPPGDFFLLGGYIAELSGPALTAALAYQGGLQLIPDHYLMNWRLGALAIETGSGELAYSFLLRARAAAPVAFPAAIYQQAQVVQAFPDDVPEEAPSACDLLAEALTQTDADPDFYTPLIAQITASADTWDCDI